MFPSLEMSLAVASFALALGGLAHVLSRKESRREVVIAVVVAALVPTTGLALYQLQQYQRRIRNVEAAIMKELGDDRLTLEQLYFALHYEDFVIVNEALFRAVEQKAVGHQVIQVRRGDGALLRLRVYYTQ